MARVILEIVSEAGRGHEIEVPEGETLSVGRSTEADYAIPHDRFLSGRHFSVTAQKDSCRIEDAGSSNGTFVNGERITKAVLLGGQTVTAAGTAFQVRVEKDRAKFPRPEGAVVIPEKPAEYPSQARMETLRREAQEKETEQRENFEQDLPAHQKQVLRILRAQTDPLWAILDAARDPAILELLNTLRPEHASLFAGESGEKLRAFGPLLAAVAPESPLLTSLVRDGWGKAWGVFLTSRQPFDGIRRHLRGLLRVRTEEGEQFFFRFYDPRVLRVFLPTCTAEEAAQVFGPVTHFFSEGEQPEELVRFRRGPQGAVAEALNLESEPA